jgi:hypothetical protein
MLGTLIVRVVKTAFIFEDNVVLGAVTLVCHRLRNLREEKEEGHTTVRNLSAPESPETRAGHDSGCNDSICRML